MQSADTSLSLYCVLLCCIVLMGSTSLGVHRWPILACQRVTLPQRYVQLRREFNSLSWERCHRGDIGFRGCSIKLKTIISSCAANAFVVADDKSYGNKQIISVTPRLYDYILDNVREPEVIELGAFNLC